jgi:two-component system cell cycle sensor histidine kinase/response regulator CckA
VEVDEGQISQVLQNLVINAKEAMPMGGAIEVKAENVTEEDDAPGELFPRKGAYVVVSIKDHGIGIPEEYIDKIFDPYFTTKQKGSGLGLATTYSIIKKHGGFIRAKSHLGIGTTFTIHLPAVRGKASFATEAKPGVVPGTGNILLMDDEEVVRDTIGEMLSFLGYRTECAQDGVEAIDLYMEARKKGDPFDLVILDLTVPGGMGGSEAMEELLAIDPNIKAIVSSGYANSPIMSEFGRYGFVDVISKPYKLEELSEAVSRVLKNKSL